ncbi:GNAT family N-acetyltransferase [Pseudalkalibacillus sp. SCS-8]|uniref:GNAT family N-acetyltransferase n=1 Tax=Pseudalkalibacillus nanhaiensis TaxID=3115291 RepID=UPI0032DBD62E
MLVELNREEFSKCRDLLNPDGQLEVKAVVEGVNPGRIFVDDRDLPTSGLVWLGNNDGFLFIGKENNEIFNQYINHLIDNIIIPDAKEINLKWFEAIGNHDGWNHTLEEVFSHRNIEPWKQRVYTLQSEDYNENSKPLLEDGYQIVKADEDLIEDKQLNSELLQSKILEFWNTSDEFFEKGIGYCAIYKKEIVSVCMSGFVVDKFHCIDIETKAEHQGKKLAQSVAHFLVRDCLDNHSVPYWDCMDENKPSIAVAENLGFKNVFNYRGYEFSLT